MTPVFADTFFYLALLSPNDEAHSRALEWARLYDGTMLTTAWVLTEVADASANPANRPAFLAFMDGLRVDPQVAIVPPSPELFDAGLGLYRERLDKDWSLTDCISFVVMQREGISDALTGDRDFAQAGFHVLL